MIGYMILRRSMIWRGFLIFSLWSEGGVMRWKGFLK